MCFFVLPLLFLLALPSTAPFNFSPPGPLYDESDPIVQLTVDNIKTTVLGSDKAWLVEFYSSWCGHCQHFAPTFKQLAKEAHAWRNVIGVAAIDCAQDSNMPSCRDFEVMGYPSLKLIPPKALIENVGSFQDCRQKEVPGLKDEMVDFVAKIEMNASYVNQVLNWPIFTPFESADTSKLWPSVIPENKNSPYSFVIYDEKNSRKALDVLLSISEATLKLPVHVPLHRVVKVQAQTELLEKLGVEGDDLPQIFAVAKSTGKGENLTPTSTSSREAVDLVKTFKDFIWREIKSLLPSANLFANNFVKGKKGSSVEKENKKKGHHPEKIHREDDIKRRRYSVYMSDLEKAILYSLSHEAAQHQIIAPEALVALQDYVDVLVRYFPARSRTRAFLQEMRDWILGHDDAIRGDDLSKKVEDLKSKLSSFDDLPSDWIGCRGSAAKFGGYPCGLWTLWHTLTVSHAKSSPSGDAKGSDARVVLKSMVSFIKHFFSCQDCARHFLLAAEDGKAIDRDVNSPQDSILWLWKTHNKVSLRLSGDITDDAAFPKETFPNKEHCTACYDTAITGVDLWSEFRIKHVVTFLRSFYSESSISMDKLTVAKEEAQKPSHDLITVLPPARQRLVHGKVDRKNFDRGSNEETWAFFSNVDVGICFSVYFLSAVILILVYLKFVAKKKFSSCITSFCPRSRSSSPYSGHNPLLGKV